MTPHVTRNEVDESGHKLPEKLAPLPLSQVVALAAGVVDLPDWLRGFDSRRPLHAAEQPERARREYCACVARRIPPFLQPAEVVEYVLAADVDDGTLGRWISD